MASQHPPPDAPREDEFPLYNPAPSAPGAPIDNPAPDAQLATGPTHGQPVPAAQGSVGRRNLLIGVAGVGAVAALSTVFTRRRGREGSLAIPAGATSFEVSTTSGDVTIRGTDGVAEGRWEGREATVGQSGDVATVEVPGGTDLVLDLPRDAEVVIRTTSGDIRIDDAELRTLELTTTSGDVDLELGRRPDSVAVTTTSGDVDISLPERGYQYSTDTRSGDVDIPDNSGDVPVTIRTTSGDIDIDEG